MPLHAGRASGVPFPLDVPSAAEIVSRPNTNLLEPSRRWHRDAAAFVIDQSGHAEFAVLQDKQPHIRHGVYETELSHALVFGHHHLHAFITRSNRFDCQEIEHYERRLTYHVDNHPGRQLPMPQLFKAGAGFEISYANIDEIEIQRVDGRVLFASPTEPLNWGMWLLQALPIAARFVEHRAADRIMIYAARPWQRSLLRAAGLSDDDIVHQELGQTYYCPELQLLQYTQVDLVPTPNDGAIFEQLRAVLAPAAERRRKRRIFLSRRSVSAASAGYRALTNEDELVDAMTELGFEVHEPENLPLADQIALFRDAEIVVGLGGAALFNVVFCDPGTLVVSIESSTAFIHNHAMLFGSLQHRFGFIIGTQDDTDPTPIHKRWTVDVAAVAQTLRRL